MIIGLGCTWSSYTYINGSKPTLRNKLYLLYDWWRYHQSQNSETPYAITFRATTVWNFWNGKRFSARNIISVIKWQVNLFNIIFLRSHGWQCMFPKFIRWIAGRQHGPNDSSCGYVWLWKEAIGINCMNRKFLIAGSRRSQPTWYSETILGWSCTAPLWIGICSGNAATSFCNCWGRHHASNMLHVYLSETHALSSDFMGS